DWPAYPLQTPSGGGLRADPGQKQDPGERTRSQVETGIDNPRPVTEGRNRLLRRRSAATPAQSCALAANEGGAISDCALRFINSMPSPPTRRRSRPKIFYRAIDETVEILHIRPTSRRPWKPPG